MSSDVGLPGWSEASICEPAVGSPIVEFPSLLLNTPHFAVDCPHKQGVEGVERGIPRQSGPSP